MKPRPLYALLATFVDARLRCLDRLTNGHPDDDRKSHQEWVDRHSERISALARNFLPSGSGFDAGTTVDLDKSTSERLVIRTSFHRMNENGYYVEWTDHTVIVTASLMHGFATKVSGRNRHGIVDYVDETMGYALATMIRSDGSGNYSAVGEGPSAGG